MKRFIIGIKSHGYGVQEAPQPGVWKLETQESWWYNAVLRSKAWEPGEPMVNSQTKAAGLRAEGPLLLSQDSKDPEKQKRLCLKAGENIHSNSRGEREIAFLDLFVLLWPSELGRCPPSSWWGWIFFTHSADWNAVFLKHPHRHTEKQCFPNSLDIP